MRRRTHAKSRNGCAQCKARRVKCNEERPICQHCALRGDPCTYTAASASVPLWATHNLPPRDNSPILSTPSSQVELELMFHFARHLFEDFASGEGPSEQLRQTLSPPELFRFQYLVNAVFAISSMHIASFKPTGSKRYLELAMRYQNDALESFTVALQNPKPESCFAMFWFSVLIGIVNLAYTRVPGIDRVACIETLIQISDLWRGSKSIMELSQEMLDPETYRKLFESSDSKPQTPGDEGEEDVLWAVHKTEKLLVSQSSPSSIDNSMSLSASDLDVAVRAIGELRNTLQSARSPLSWLVTVEPRFMLLLGAVQQHARLIGIVYGVVLHNNFQGKWWGQDFGKDLVDELTVGLQPESRPYHSDIVVWAHKKVGLDT